MRAFPPETSVPRDSDHTFYSVSLQERFRSKGPPGGGEADKRRADRPESHLVRVIYQSELCASTATPPQPMEANNRADSGGTAWYVVGLLNGHIATNSIMCSSSNASCRWGDA